MLWTDAEAAIRAAIETGWAAGAYAAMPLVFENETPPAAASYMAVSVEGVYADKTIYGSAGKRLAIEAGIVFFHAFVPVGGGKAAATGPVAAMTALLELQSIAGAIQLEGDNPPSPAAPGDSAVPGEQPGGNWYRCSGSVPFIVIGAR